MKKRLVVLLCGFVLLTVAASVAMVALDTQSEHGKPEPPAAGVHWAKGQKPSGGGSPFSPNLSYHGGPIMVSATVTPIFWGTTWDALNPKVDGINSFYDGMGNTVYARTVNEYTAGTSKVSDSISRNGYLIDNSPASGGNRTSTILNEVCKMVPKPVSNGYYPVYVDGPRGNAGFCAWHSASTCGGKTVYFAFFFNLDGDAGCDPQDTQTGHPQGLAALANVSGHELSEARSDPGLNAWYDRSGAENSDKCAWTFGANNPVAFSNGTFWKIQGNWSNAAYSGGYGYPNSSGQKGCIN